MIYKYKLLKHDKRGFSQPKTEYRQTMNYPTINMPL